MLEAVAFELDAAKPTGYAHDAIRAVFFLQNAENDHAGAGFAVITLCFVNRTFVTEACRPAVVVGFGIFLVSFEGF